MRGEPIFHKGVEYRVWYKHFSKLGNKIYKFFRIAAGIEQVKSYRKDIVSPLTHLTHMTLCCIETKNRVSLAYGFAFCSVADNFCRKTGREVALNRALDLLDRRLEVNGPDIIPRKIYRYKDETGEHLITAKKVIDTYYADWKRETEQEGNFSTTIEECLKTFVWVFDATEVNDEILDV